MNTSVFVCLITLLLVSAAALADCPRVPDQEDDRRANAGCLIVEGDKVLLLTHRLNGKLGVPGGTLKKGEWAQCTAYRETLEESGLAVTVGERVQVMKNGFHLYRCYPNAIPETLTVPVSGKWEVSDLGWYALDQLQQDDWRFPYQFDLFVETVRPLLSSPQSAEPR